MTTARLDSKILRRAQTVFMDVSDPFPIYTTADEAAAAAPVQSVDGEVGEVDLSGVYEPLGAVPAQVSAQEIIDTTETETRMWSPADVQAMIDNALA